ncbi:unnamed protein product [Nyctereutes procyonoides]|uniref:(raccoon dog) hypothetical protein n=1 Tax=Nyctereutes procyonoides TaxID=34880 RepID=A0A811YDB6_NYCPR|nr:unnamed protein product [Nyctereutes procyonoides]
MWDSIPDQWNRIENPEVDPEFYGQLIFVKGGKTIHWKKDSLFNKWCWENWTSTCRRMKLDHSLSPYTKINSKWMKDLNVRQDSIKILEENTGNTLFELSHSNFLQDTSTKAKETKAKMNSAKWQSVTLCPGSRTLEPLLFNHYTTPIPHVLIPLQNTSRPYNITHFLHVRAHSYTSNYSLSKKPTKIVPMNYSIINLTGLP